MTRCEITHFRTLPFMQFLPENSFSVVVSILRILLDETGHYSYSFSQDDDLFINPVKSGPK